MRPISRRAAFTLIELLVVIAIIAILAAILFPVFAQAKTAAKKTAALSNQKQISTGLLLYMGDNEDRYPMRTGCEQGSSINPDLRVAALQGASGSNVGCTGRFYNSMSWQTWQKYIFPYVKNTDLFMHPLRTKDATQWSQNGQILNSFAINLGLTGAAVSGFETTPWTGGTQSGIPNVSSALLLMELPHTYAAPLLTNGSANNGVTNGITMQTGYNLADREYWRAIFLTNSGSGCNTTEVPDSVGAGPAQGVTVGHADGSAKFYSVGSFLGKTPTHNEYFPSASFPYTGVGTNCRNSTNAARYTGAITVVPNLNINYPLWALGQ
ncbi:prepilin-type N-terminal cleavage/methylation domain-containing protein [bacterium]|nr:MAG: prepilin-type N-terminal cleavage/methylation domain-containing protein [bacterium]